MKTNKCIEALLTAKDGNWNQAHQIVQDINTNDAAWVHAYLHRVEGDLGNAAYWYRRAGCPECTSPLEEEWSTIFDALGRATS